MKKSLTVVISALLLAVLLQVRCEARPVYRPSLGELEQKADVIALLRVDEIRESSAKLEDHGISNDGYHAYTAECSVVSVFKGEQDAKKVSLLFFQHPDGRPGYNGVIPAPFFEELTRTEEDRTAYLAYLKKDGKGGLMPVTGHQDAGVSIKAIPPIAPLTPHFSVLQPRDRSGKPVGRKDSTEPGQPK